MVEGPRWRKKIGAMGKGNYPYLMLPSEFRHWIGLEVEIKYIDGSLIITPVQENTKGKDLAEK